jgi:hypothetical protein
MSLTSSLGEFASARIQAGLEEKMQAYRNTMSKLSAARATNAVQVNEARTVDAATIADAMMQRQALQDQGRVEMEAAASGTTGNSVKMVMDDLKASAGRASYAQKRQTSQALSEMREDRKSIAINSVLNKDIQVIPKPSIGSALLGAGTNLLNIYDSHQPEGSRILGPNGGRVNDKNLL